MTIYAVTIKNAKGVVKEVISSKKLSERHWDRFLDYQPMDLGLPFEVTGIGSDQPELDRFMKETV